MYNCDPDQLSPQIGKIIVLSRSKAKNFTSDRPWAAISIDTFPEWPKLNKCQQVGLLQLEFADINCREDVGPELLAMHPDLPDRLFTEEHANQILDFVQKHWDEIEVLMVHCYAGLCRSPAVAAAIHKIFQNDDDSAFFSLYTPNSRVYTTILTVANQRGLYPKD
jgi:predicted protein tyrosine phosphatase